MPPRRRTSTSNFGVGRREAHDARAFYARFEAPELSDDETVRAPAPVAEPFVHGDARHMTAVADGSVALVVTSPPYFAGKQYEEELDRQGVPSSYLEYLRLLEEVFADCARTLEPGGRIAVNVANLGRKPYRSLAADVMAILQDRLRLLPRGEIVWRKAEGASGSCAWGSFRSAANPVLRDVTERVVVASKGRFSRARSVAERQAAGLPHRSTLTTDDFMAYTLDVWDVPPESARRVHHPAPFPVELPARLIQLYTFEDDLVLDPFMGSGSTLVAAELLGRRYVGYDLDEGYVQLARDRVAEARRAAGTGRSGTPAGDPGSAHATPSPADDGGKAALALAEDVLEDAGFKVAARRSRIRGTGVAVDFTAVDADGTPWFFDVSGPHTTHRGGMLRTDAVWRSLGRCHALAGGDARPVVLLTTCLPRRPSAGDTALRAAGPGAVFDVVTVLADEGRERLRRYAAGGQAGRPLPGFWSHRDLDREAPAPAPPRPGGEHAAP
jgi:DNA modification methylase